MMEKDIKNRLIEIFNAPKKMGRRIVFWYDSKEEFKELVDELELDGVQLVHHHGSNSFYVKKLLLRDLVDENVLVYTTEEVDEKKNWLLDIQLYSEEFRADHTSMLVDELGLEQTRAYIDIIDEYQAFFKNKDRKSRLKKIVDQVSGANQLRVAFMCALAGMETYSYEEFMIKVLSAGEGSKITEEIEKFGRIEDFWNFAERTLGYKEEEPSFDNLTSHLLLSAQAHTLKSDVYARLEKRFSREHGSFSYGLVHQWQLGSDKESLYRLARAVEDRWELVNYFKDADIDDMVDSDIFPIIDSLILNKYFDLVSEGVVSHRKILEVVESRRTLGWAYKFSDYYGALEALARMEAFKEEHEHSLHLVDAREIWDSYKNQLYLFDRYYRDFHHSYSRALSRAFSYIDDGLKRAGDYVEDLYTNWYLLRLSDIWDRAIENNLKSLGYVSEIARQEDFYSRYVGESLSSKTRAFVIISDALRYEVGVELKEKINITLAGRAELDAMQAVFPSITKTGMAALLPGKQLAFNEKWEVLRDGKTAKSTKERWGILNDHATSLALTFKNLHSMKRDERRAEIADTEVVYIYHNAIDALGDSPITESQVFEGCNQAIEEVLGIMRILVNELNATDIYITADHGFLYTFRPLEETDKLSYSIFSGHVFEQGKRYSLVKEDTKVDHLLTVGLEKLYNNSDIKGLTPRGVIRLKTQGGGSNYVHGGVSLQELMVPAIRYKHVRAGQKRYVEIKKAGLELISQTRRISNMVFNLEFYQTEATGDKVKESVFAIYFTDAYGGPISDKQQLIADRKNANAHERKYKLHFNLISGEYDRKEDYYLIMENEDGIQHRITFSVDVAFSDDYGLGL